MTCVAQKRFCLSPLSKRKGCNIAFMGSGDRHSLVSARLSEREAQARIPFVAHGT